MCGLAGLWRMFADWQGDRLRSVTEDMADAIRHRGPDGGGVWVDAQAGISLGHRRLAIVDLSPTGAQPMASHDGRYQLVFNGEIYNFPELRAELAGTGTVFRSSGDTEVMLEAFSRWGVLAACKRMAGMFAFALWDRSERSLTLGRDRLGKKPLYVAQLGTTWAFASEIKSLRRIPGFSPEVSPSAIAEFLRYGYVGEGACILQGVCKVQPGQLLRIASSGDVWRETFWSLAPKASASRHFQFEDQVEAKETLLQLLGDATRARMVADVPLGAFLSGGIDSGLTVALMQRAGLGTTRTFSIGFEEATHDEAPVARQVAAHLGTQHTELYVTQKQALDMVPRLADIFDEPFADSSQIPTALLAQLARQYVTVALTGDGGDEAFGGYLRYRNEEALTGWLYGLPSGVRHGMSAALAALPGAAWDGVARVLPARRRPRFLGSKVAKLSRALRLDSAQARARQYLCYWDPQSIMSAAAWAQVSSTDDIVIPAGLHSSEAMQYWETLHYLPGDLLTKMDRATMAASLEARSPLLDHRVVEFAWQLAPELKAGRKALKYLLRQALFDFVPREIVDLPKQGFSVPIGAWMTSQLRPFAEDMLDFSYKHLDHLLDRDAVKSLWAEHLRGASGHTEKLWCVIMLSQWWQRWQGVETGGAGAKAL